MEVANVVGLEVRSRRRVEGGVECGNRRAKKKTAAVRTLFVKTPSHVNTLTVCVSRCAVGTRYIVLRQRENTGIAEIAKLEVCTRRRVESGVEYKAKKRRSATLTSGQNI